MNKRALTLLEIIISVVILALVMTGMVNVFVAGKQFVQRSRNRMTAGELEKQFIEPLQSQVRQDNWSTNYLGTSTNPPQATSPDGKYKADYTVSTPAYDTDIRKVVTKVSWTPE